MNVNVKLSLTDEERNTLAGRLSGKPVKRLATRADVNAFVRGCLDAAVSADPEPEVRSCADLEHDLPSIYQPDPEDRERLAGCSASYIAGWNQVKHRSRSKAVVSES